MVQKTVAAATVQAQEVVVEVKDNPSPFQRSWNFYFLTLLHIHSDFVHLPIFLKAYCKEGIAEVSNMAK